MPWEVTPSDGVSSEIRRLQTSWCDRTTEALAPHVGKRDRRTVPRSTRPVDREIMSLQDGLPRLGNGVKTRDAAGVDANDGGLVDEKEWCSIGRTTIPDAALSSPREGLTVAGTFATRQTE